MTATEAGWKSGVRDEGMKVGQRLGSVGESDGDGIDIRRKPGVE